ncbi:uncharacterized protein LOC129960799 [Argiope bruennichi]|uniref:Uncharacterized protein n=1 Tax=Argiope bruennichi TaxID=94029 RepID=A0A8T0FH95_ARGBR|nr:uncharacterized protein LOC129960799 [Argiope bruennichi]XP_055930426.1 uncharacterized protein LOC129960799 [Argiope bruennichi]KAF8790361.1 hypothetical protein HNY73_005391 [Argiope bruennichi]
MGCSPSQSSSAILVEPRRSPSINEMKSSNELPTESQKDEFLKEMIDDTDLPNEEFLQESMKSSKSEGSSKSSSSSWDSGVYELEDDYSHVITENSDPGKVREVDNEFVPNEDLELILVGKACPARLSARDRDMMEQQTILQVLREEGLIVRPPSRAVGGIRFELIAAQNALSNQSSSIRKLPPLSIRKKHKEKKAELTHEEIQQKLMQAEERRKKRTEEKLNKLATKDRQEIQTIAEQQAEINRQKLNKKLQIKAESREKYLNEMQEKLKAREEHAQKVRERKKMLANGFKYVLPNGTN